MTKDELERFERKVYSLEEIANRTLQTRGVFPSEHASLSILLSSGVAWVEEHMAEYLHDRKRIRQESMRSWGFNAPLL